MTSSQRRQSIVSKKTLQELYSKYDGRCAICGRIDTSFEVAHIMPVSIGGKNEPDNLILVCPICHRSMDGPKEIEFVHYLEQLLLASGGFHNVQNDVKLSAGPDLGVRADLIFEEQILSGRRKVLIECKRDPAFTSARLDIIIDQIKAYSYIADSIRTVLAFPGRLSAEDHKKLAEQSIELWDIDYIAKTFAKQIKEIEHPYFQPLFLAILSQKGQSEEERLLNRLKACNPGKKDWGLYQKLIGNILEYVFCPPLRSPIPQSSDSSNVNRRDFILPNYTSDGFWKFIRDRYRADYIVVDAKNYRGKVKKEDALQIANYLKLHGVGLFGMIICRSGNESGCSHTLREQWTAHDKLIIVIDDKDVEAMLLAKSSGGNPEEIISQKIEGFRLSI